MSKMQRRVVQRSRVATAVMLALAAQFPANQALANAGFGVNTDISGATINVPTYFASSPQGIQPGFDPVTHTLSPIDAKTGLPTVWVDTGKPIRKFIDRLAGAYNGLGGLPGAADLQTGIPVAIPETNWVNPVSGVVTKDHYYEIAVVEYTERLHTDLAKATRLRGYVQIETDAIKNLKDITGALGTEHIKAMYPDGVTPILDDKGAQVYFVHKPHYLGPTILAAKGTPVRIKFNNYLPYVDNDGHSVGSWNGKGGELPIPVDETIPGGGPVLDAEGKQVYAKDANNNPIVDGLGKPIPVTMGQNRVAIHWHGGDSPWTSDGTPHQWFAPRGDISYKLGVDTRHPSGMGKGESAVNVPDMADPGPGSYTLYYPNNLSGRMMFYHDHASGITRLNVYQGMAAGYVVYDPVELKLVADALGTTTATTGNVTLANPAGGNVSVNLPTGLLDTVGIPLVIQDKGFVPKNIGPGAVDSAGNPASQDAKWDQAHWGQEGDFFFPHVYETNQDPNSIDGTNPVGRWDWGPWFWPVFPAQYSLPTGDYGDVTTTPESFMDTSVVNGQVYPTLTVDPKAYRFRILSVANDRAYNLGLYQAVDANGNTCRANRTPAAYPVAPGSTDAPALCTEVKMVPALPTAGFPATWPTDGRAGGVPDPATAGPDIVQIGSEGGLLPAPAVWKSQPVNYETNVRSITVFNVLDHDLLLAPGERADVLVDFSKYAGQTLILYNDAPAPMPGLDPRIDYHTGGGDFTDAGGAFNTLPGYGPNTRTVMQIKVNATNTSGAGGPLNVAALAAAMPAAYAKTQPPPLIPEKAYNGPFGTNQQNNYASIGTGSAATNGLFTYTDNGVTKTMKVINKAIQELFDPIYGRMNATLAVELPFSSATVATTIPLSYIDEPVESLDAIKDGETQIWKITHNGVDDHPVHFHLVNVQVINRVGWDGTIKPPDANEVGWKETLRMNPLEDVYVAVKAVRPAVPFGLPKSNRLLDPSMALDSQLGFTQISPVTGQAPQSPYKNKLLDFDNEYVWHCHILGHEEFDFMRPFIFHPTVLQPDAPAAVKVNGSTVSWTDTTPYGGQDAEGIPTAGTNAAYPEPTCSPKNEVGFRVFGTKNGVDRALATLPANVTSWTATNAEDIALLGDKDATISVVAFNAHDLPSDRGVAATTTNAGALVGPAIAPTYASTPAPAPSAPTGVTGLTETVNASGSITLRWVAVPGATGYAVSVNGGAPIVVTGTSTVIAKANLAPGANAFSVVAQTPNGATAAASANVYNGAALVPVALTASQGNQGNGSPPGSITLTWANNPQNVNNVSGLTLSWAIAGTGNAFNTVGSLTVAPTVTGATIINLPRGRQYEFRLVANSAIGNSPQATVLGTSSP